MDCFTVAAQFKQTLHLTMKKTLSILALFLTAVAPLGAKTSVWKVQSGDHVVYVGGTIHLLRESDYPLPKEFDEAFARSTELWLETDLGAMATPEAQQLMDAEGVYRDGRTLEQAIGPKAWAEVRNYCGSIGISPAQIAQLKPWYFVINIAAIELQKLGVTPNGVDAHFYAMAQPAGKSVQGLETFEQQVHYLATMGAGHESEMIMQSLEELGDMQDSFKAMLAAWRAGDLEKLDEDMLAEMREKYPAIYQSIILERNQAWLKAIDGMLQTEPVEYVLVGVAHLAGDKGLIRALQQKGYQVTQLNAAN